MEEKEVSYKITKFGVNMGNRNTHQTFLMTIEDGITFQKHLSMVSIADPAN